MQLSKLKNLILFIAVVLITIGSYVVFVNSEYYNDLESFAKENLIILFVTVVIIKFIGIVWPPLPGGVVSLAAIPLIGWQNAYVADFIGSITGALVCYYLGQKYGEKILLKFFDQSTISKMQRFKLKQDNEFEFIFITKAFLGSVITEVISYGAGYLNVRFRTFFAASILAHIAVGIPIFYLTNNIASEQNRIFYVILVIIGITIMFTLRKRYFDNT